MKIKRWCDYITEVSCSNISYLWFIKIWFVDKPNKIVFGVIICCSVNRSCLTLCDPVDCSTPGFPVHHQLPEFTQTHAHWVGDAIQPSHPLLSPFPSAFNFSQRWGLFWWVNSLHQVAKVLELQLQHQSFQRIFRIDFLQDWLVWSPFFPRDSR